MTTIRATLALSAMLLLGGCVSYYERHYGDPGVYYGGGYETVHHRPVAYSVNPVYYPYWSLDYFYFSRYYHPYSVFVGYHEPLFYPYPGWAFGGYYAGHRYGYRVGYRGGLGFGYPWYGHGHFYPRYSLGFFVGGGYRGDRYHGGHHGQLRRIDRRLAALQDPAPVPSRASLVGRERRDAMTQGIRTGFGNDRSNDRSRSRIESSRLRAADPSASRSAMLQRDSTTDRGGRVVQRGAPESRRGGYRAPEARIDRREVLQGRGQAPRVRDPGMQRRSPEPSIRRAPEIRRSPGIEARSRSVPPRANDAQRRSIRAAPPPRVRSVEPPRVRNAPRVRQERSAPRVREQIRRSPPPRPARATAPSRSSGDRRQRMRSESVRRDTGGRSRVDRRKRDRGRQ